MSNFHKDVKSFNKDVKSFNKDFKNSNKDVNNSNKKYVKILKNHFERSKLSHTVKRAVLTVENCQIPP